MFEQARSEAAVNTDLIPYWIYEGSVRVERCVPMLPFSRECHAPRVAETQSHCLSSGLRPAPGRTICWTTSRPLWEPTHVLTISPIYKFDSNRTNADFLPVIQTGDVRLSFRSHWRFASAKRIQTRKRSPSRPPEYDRYPVLLPDIIQRRFVHILSNLFDRPHDAHGRR